MREVCNDDGVEEAGITGEAERDMLARGICRKEGECGTCRTVLLAGIGVGKVAEAEELGEDVREYRR